VGLGVEDAHRVRVLLQLGDQLLGAQLAVLGLQVDGGLGPHAALGEHAEAGDAHAGAHHHLGLGLQLRHVLAVGVVVIDVEAAQEVGGHGPDTVVGRVVVGQQGVGLADAVGVEAGGEVAAEVERAAEVDGGRADRECERPDGHVQEVAGGLEAHERHVLAEQQLEQPGRALDGREGDAALGLVLQLGLDLRLHAEVREAVEQVSARRLGDVGQQLPHPVAADRLAGLGDVQVEVAEGDEAGAAGAGVE
jgi:hypothetical protein